MKFNLLILMSAILLFAACDSHNHENENEEHSHENDSHEHSKIKLTKYTKNFELFAEADPFIVGENADILAHFTHIPSFKPLINTPVTAVLLIDGTEVKQTVKKPVRNGIYSFKLKPTKKGHGKLSFYIDTSEIVVNEIHVNANHHGIHENTDYAEPSMINKVVFTKEQSWKIDFKTENVKQQAFGKIIKTVAKIQANTGNEKLVSAKTSGIVIYTDDNIIEGKSIVNGQKLFSISSAGMSDNNLSVKIKEAENNYKRTEADYLRKKELAEEDIISKKDLQYSENKYQNAKAVYDNLINNFNKNGQTISSPMSGFIKQVLVKNGEYVSEGQALMSVSQNEKLILNAYVQQKFSNLLSSINSANIKTLHNNQYYTLAELNGKILSYGKSVSDNNFLIPVNLQIDNKADFIQGSLVEVYLQTLTNTKALTVPNSALLEKRGNYFVFIQHNPELFEKRQVEIGHSNGIYTEIISNLNANERIISKGAVLVELAQASGALDPHSGHVH